MTGESAHLPQPPQRVSAVHQATGPAAIQAVGSGGQVRRLLFIRTDRLGETLLNLPAVAALRAALPQATLTLLVHPDLESLLASAPGVDRVLACAQGARQTWWARACRLGAVLRRYRFDIAVVSNPMRELHLAVWLAGIPRRVGYSRKWGRLLTHRLEDRKALGERHEVEYNLDLVRALGLPTGASHRPWPPFEREQAEVCSLLEGQGVRGAQPFLAVHPWASNRLKEWPMDRYRVVIREAAERFGLGVAVIGGAEETSRAAAELPAGLPIANLVGRLSLRQLAALLQRTRLLISNDSGPAHLAAAVGTPTVVLFGTAQAPAGPHRWGPWGDGHRVLWKPSMDEVTVKEVVDALAEQLRAP